MKVGPLKLGLINEIVLYIPYHKILFAKNMMWIENNYSLRNDSMKTTTYRCKVDSFIFEALFPPFNKWVSLEARLGYSI